MKRTELRFHRRLSCLCRIANKTTYLIRTRHCRLTYHAYTAYLRYIEEPQSRSYSWLRPGPLFSLAYR